MLLRTLLVLALGAVVAVEGGHLRTAPGSDTGAIMPKVEGEWRQYAVPAGEPNAGKIFFYNSVTKAKTWDRPAAMGGSSTGKWITIQPSN